MRCLLLATLSVLWVARPLAAQAPPSASGARVPMLSASDAQVDFDVLRRALEEAHGGLYRYRTKPELDRRFDAARAQLTTPVSQLAFARLLSETIATIGDGHARLELDSLTIATLADACVFPLRVQLEGERLMLQYNDSPADTTLRPGMELRSINGHPVSAVVGALLPTVAGDGEILTGKRTRLARTFATLYWLFVEQASTYVITARDAGGRTVMATLAGIREADRLAVQNPVNATLLQHAARLAGPRGNISVAFSPDASVAHLRVRAFDGATFVATLDSAFAAINANGTRSLLLDLRGNGGGVDLYGAALVSHFIDRPFRYFDRIELTTIAPSFATWKPATFENLRTGTVPGPTGGFRVTPTLHEGVAMQSPAAVPFRGTVVVLIDGGSFSTTADVAGQLRAWGRATFVGEETAGDAAGNTSGLNALIVLPHSQLRLKVMMYGYWNAVHPDTPGRGTRPDHVVVARIADLLQGTDAALELARRLVK